MCLVYDSTESSSFDALDFWVNELKEQADKKILINVVASKTDNSEAEEVPVKQASDYSK